MATEEAVSYRTNTQTDRQTTVTKAVVGSSRFIFWRSVIHRGHIMATEEAVSYRLCLSYNVYRISVIRTRAFY